MKILFAVLSPRDIPQVIESMQKCPYDQVWLKYHYEGQAWHMARQIFLQNEQYSHLVVWPDDVVYNDHAFYYMQDLVKGDDSFKVVAGYVNVDYPIKNNFVNCSLYSLPSIDRKSRTFLWETKDYMERHLEWYHCVKFSGGPFLFNREILDKCYLDGDSPGSFNDNSQDVVTCNWLHDRNIPIWIPSASYFLHMRYGAEIMTGRKQAYQYWQLKEKT